jgi:hypothetical protein
MLSSVSTIAPCSQVDNDRLYFTLCVKPLALLEVRLTTFPFNQPISGHKESTYIPIRLDLAQTSPTIANQKAGAKQGSGTPSTSSSSITEASLSPDNSKSDTDVIWSILLISAVIKAKFASLSWERNSNFSSCALVTESSKFNFRGLQNRRF